MRRSRLRSKMCCGSAATNSVWCTVTRHHVARAVVPFIRRFNPQAKVVFNNADLHFLRELRTALALNDGELLRRSRLTRDLELEIMRITDLTVSYNEVEHAVILSHNLDQTRIAKAPWVVAPAEAIASLRERSDIGFLGSFGHKPNVDALKFFAQEVMPLLRQSRPRHPSECFRQSDRARRDGAGKRIRRDQRTCE